MLQNRSLQAVQGDCSLQHLLHPYQLQRAQELPLNFRLTFSSQALRFRFLQDSLQGFHNSRLKARL